VEPGDIERFRALPGIKDARYLHFPPLSS